MNKLNYLAKINILFLTIILLNACNHKHDIKLGRDNLISQELSPPGGCYHANIVVNGSFLCSTKVILYMDSKKTNFLHNNNLIGKYENEILYSGDWYENSLQLALDSGHCVEDEAVFYVTFYD